MDTISSFWFERARGALSRRIRRVVRPAAFGSLRRLQPLSESSGYDRGLPIDRHYVGDFLSGFRSDVCGRIVEVRDARYTTALGSAVVASDVLDIDAENSSATIVADLCSMPHVPDSRFDCAIVTQTLQYVSDPRAALAELARVLAPGGVLLATVPGAPPLDSRASQLDRWRFTHVWLEELIAETFGAGEIVSLGNALSLVGAVMGVASEELSEAELHHRDERFPVVFGVRAVRR